MSKFKTSKKTKSIVLTLVSILLIAGLAGLLIGIFTNPQKDVDPDFSRGKLDANGKYVESMVTLYTEDPIECQGLKVSFDFEFDGQYQIFWYNEDGIFLHSEPKTDKAFNDPVPELAKYCRIVVYPVLKDGDKEISWYQIGKYSGDLNVTVDRYQEFKPENHYETAKLFSTSDIELAGNITANYSFIKNAKLAVEEYGEVTELSSFSESLEAAADGYNVVKLDCSDVGAYKLKFDKVCGGGQYHVFFFDAEGNALDPAKAINVKEGGEIIVNVMAEAKYICFNVYPADLVEGGKDIPIVINEYLPR